MLREYVCRNPACSKAEAVASASASSGPVCLGCNRAMEIRLFPVSTVFTGVITARYNDKGTPGAHLDGHWGWRRKSSKVPGKPEPVFIETWDQQRDFCRAEGLANPKEMPRNFEIGEDGKGAKNTMGMPGSEV